ncbi:hypothetical protein NS220_01175 [Microbacterium testaceum]|uniref:Uncharacterized protein n=1 Tax=Microbacterium testaceum TaxID=2033 RepID=A0A147F1C6_MICTE|nr:hypothetical protein NS220_01175 [Microbacterium testaceum]
MGTSSDGRGGGDYGVSHQPTWHIIEGFQNILRRDDIVDERICRVSRGLWVDHRCRDDCGRNRRCREHETAELSTANIHVFLRTC